MSLVGQVSQIHRCKQPYIASRRLDACFTRHRQPSRRGSSCSAVLPELQTILQQASTAHPGWAAGAVVNTGVFIAGSPVLLKGLTGWGMVNAFILGTTVYAAFGAGGFALLCIYFLFGTAVSFPNLQCIGRERPWQVNAACSAKALHVSVALSRTCHSVCILRLQKCSYVQSDG